MAVVFFYSPIACSATLSSNRELDPRTLRFQYADDDNVSARRVRERVNGGESITRFIAASLPAQGKCEEGCHGTTMGPSNSGSLRPSPQDWPLVVIITAKYT